MQSLPLTLLRHLARVELTARVSKYRPHQGEREKARRRRHTAEGRIDAAQLCRR